MVCEYIFIASHCNQLEHLTESYAQIIQSLHGITEGYHKSLESARVTRSHLMNITDTLRGKFL